jgi:hypothetical protein
MCLESSKTTESKPFYRILDAEENVWKAQQRWRSRAGKFILERRETALLYERVSLINTFIYYRKKTI